jgi:hypothetical protein
MERHAESHVDHGLTSAQLEWLLDRFADRDSFFIETVELPDELGTAPCGLYGPDMGDEPVPESEVRYANRGEREWPSRLVDRPDRPTRMVTVIGGPHDGHACILYTAYAGPCAPQEPRDPGCKDVPASEQYWAEHALAASE